MLLFGKQNRLVLIILLKMFRKTSKNITLPGPILMIATTVLNTYTGNTQYKIKLDPLQLILILVNCLTVAQ